VKRRPVELKGRPPVEDRELKARAAAFRSAMATRRSVRAFDPSAVPLEAIVDCLKTAGASPSGANQQPWHFVVVTDPKMKRRIREAAEAQERKFYEAKAPQAWLEALAPLGTGPEKPFLEDAPCLIVVFERKYGLDAKGHRIAHYYTRESTGIAAGFLIAALHLSGLACLTYTPSPMTFLNKLLDRPANESPFLILVTGRPAKDAAVPDLKKKTLDELVTFI
jgi:iodotyrosine deiodinase